jgi:hypothetical protein
MPWLDIYDSIEEEFITNTAGDPLSANFADTPQHDDIIGVEGEERRVLRTRWIVEGADAPDAHPTNRGVRGIVELI